MAVITALVLAGACLAVNALPQKHLPFRTTIFGDEQLEGGPFEFSNSITNFPLTTDNPYRLPTTTKPHHYTLNLFFDMVSLSFSGNVEIELSATQPGVDEIVLHAHDMDIRSVLLRQDGRNVFRTYTRQPEYHFLRVQLTSETLEYNSTYETQPVYTLSINFAAPLRRDMTGLYRNWYRNNPEDPISYMASTHFQATAARFAFPCYDEPSFKATFDVRITRPTGFGSWFCTRRNDTVNSTTPGYEQDIYSTTPVMSTYLLAIIVAEYKSVSDAQGSDLNYEVIARPAAMDDNQYVFAYDLGQRLLAEMSNHTGMDFYDLHPNLKMTHAAIPDFSAGAMENWGLLVYREAYLMHSSNHTNGYFEQLIAYILSHEIAHMWFGNLVTCDWWDNLWLNEGFARYYQYFLTDEVQPLLGLGERFIPEQIHTALLTDSANNPHPMTNPGLGSPVEVRTMFTQISYNKGAAIIRMTEHLMGYENHRKGLQRYLKNRQFNTALPIHLFQALQDVAVETGAISNYSGFNIIDYYKTWSEQSGHPVLFVDVNYQKGEMVIYQNRFNINSGFSTASSNWIIPITFTTAYDADFENTKPSHIIRNSITVINIPPGDRWVLFNKQQTGFYRVYYDDYTWDLITMELKNPNGTSIHEYNRAQIVNDVFQFARSGIMNYTRAFNILSFLSNETRYTPWMAAITGFNWIRNRVIGTPLESQLNNMFIEWATPIMSQLTYYPIEDELYMRSYLRYQLAPVMCQLEVQECRDAAWNQYQELRVNDMYEVPVDSRNWVYCNALRDGTVDDFDYLWERFETHPVYNEKIQLLMVLGCTPHADSLNKFLNAIVQENYLVRRQDYTTAFNSAATGNENNTQIVFEYIKNNFDNVTAAFNSVTTGLSYVSSRLRTKDEVNDFRQWADENQALLGASYQEVRNAAQTSLSAIEWAELVQPDMNNYFTSEQLLSTSTQAPTTTTTAQTFTLPNIQAPVTPNLTDAANEAFISTLALAAAVIANYLL